MTHPRREFFAFAESVKQHAGLGNCHFGASVLPPSRSLDLCPLEVCDELHAIADAEDGSYIEKLLLRSRSIVSVNRVWTAAQDDARRVPLSNPVDIASRGMNLGINSRFS